MTAAKKTGLELLREPFAPNQIGKLPKPYKRDSVPGNCKDCGGWHGLPALHLDYVGHAALTDRLLDADPNWSWEPVSTGPDGLPVFDAFGGLWIRLTVCGVTRLGYGDAQGKNGSNAVKEAIGDALRNAGMRFGAALDLWHRGDLHDADEAAGKVNVPRYGVEEARIAIRLAAGDEGVLRKAWSEAKAHGAGPDVLDMIKTAATAAAPVEGKVV